jgi:hypothetical protein
MKMRDYPTNRKRAVHPTPYMRHAVPFLRLHTSTHVSEICERFNLSRVTVWKLCRAANATRPYTRQR